jgi:dTDP-glucose pyrophosphorylase
MDSLRKVKNILEKYPDIQYLDLGENRGMQHALNVGVMQAENSHVFIINDDNVLPNEWDDRTKYAVDFFDSKFSNRSVLTIDQVEPTGPGMFNFTVHDLGQTVETFQYEEWLTYEDFLVERTMARRWSHLPIRHPEETLFSCGWI